MVTLLCENGIHLTDGVSHSLKCKIINDNCTFIRWCINDNCIKMTPLAIKCRHRGEIMKEKEIGKVKEQIDFKNNIKNSIKEEVCKVCFIKGNKLILDFKGYGIEIILDDNFDKSKIKNNINVKYKSDIGKYDFEIISY